MIVGFTGTRRGLTAAQRAALKRQLSELKPIVLWHGGCVGADSDADWVADTLGLSRAVFLGHLDAMQMSLSQRAQHSEIAIYPPQDTIARNHQIVDACDVLIACPGEAQEKLRSGTWATIRYARKTGRKLIILFPSGQVVRQ